MGKTWVRTFSLVQSGYESMMQAIAMKFGFFNQSHSYIHGIPSYARHLSWEETLSDVSFPTPPRHLDIIQTFHLNYHNASNPNIRAHFHLILNNHWMRISSRQRRVDEAPRAFGSSPLSRCDTNSSA
ncbi:hypothetical protein PM082_000702 [Marasmius tenuissimus]|nr:hypothetical protein PM082_000702 [Marasmius tenuissimus]